MPDEREARHQRWLDRYLRAKAEDTVLDRHADEIEVVIAELREQREAEKKAQ